MKLHSIYDIKHYANNVIAYTVDKPIDYVFDMLPVVRSIDNLQQLIKILGSTVEHGDRQIPFITALGAEPLLLPITSVKRIFTNAKAIKQLSTIEYTIYAAKANKTAKLNALSLFLLKLYSDHELIERTKLERSILFKYTAHIPVKFTVETQYTNSPYEFEVLPLFFIFEDNYTLKDYYYSLKAVILSSKEENELLWKNVLQVAITHSNTNYAKTIHRFIRSCAAYETLTYKYRTLLLTFVVSLYKSALDIYVHADREIQNYPVLLDPPHNIKWLWNAVNTLCEKIRLQRPDLLEKIQKYKELVL